MQNQLITEIKEIFSSIQGEGPYVGQKHTFVRFCKCNLACKYCDTSFISGTKYNIDELFKILLNENTETISFTGGEPLLENVFLLNFLKAYKNKLNKKIYLETNGTLFYELEKVIDYVDIVSMDIKLKSATGQENRFLDNEKFIEIASKKELFIKVVFDNNLQDDEIEAVISLAQKNKTLIVLQPKMPFDSEIKLDEIYNKFFEKYKNVRLIPQTHKFLNLA